MRWICDNKNRVCTDFKYSGKNQKIFKRDFIRCRNLLNHIKVYLDEVVADFDKGKNEHPLDNL